MIIRPHLTPLKLRVRDRRPWTFCGAAGRRADERTGSRFDRLAVVWRNCGATLVTGPR